ncbi:GATA-type zinc finger protein 1-like [Rhipicephalus sanguineus]|uniref:GATA-type zinc finger protein 1-like n=1 Tax=Rhipicephalus sanguineus TaxID=34632 RepID=UPI001895B0C8|nr:GATA-type zinc finger protein 1-like [Rhipicephalus sanguineus]
MTSQSDFGSSEFRCGACEHSAPSLCPKSFALADVRRFDGSGGLKVFPYDNRYCEPYQPCACSPPSDKYMRRCSPSEASRSHSRNTPDGAWYLADSAPVDVNCGLFSPPSRHAELRSSDLDYEPFSTYGETERLIKIHYLAEELVAREAAVAATNHDDTDWEEVDSGSCSSPETSPAKSPFPSMTSLSLKTLTESSLMPLAETADTSVRASVQEASSGKCSSTISAGASKKQPPTESVELSSPLTSCGLDIARCSNDSPGGHPSSAAATQGCGRRKKAVPRKSPTADDPNFKGAVVHMRLQMVNGKPKLKMDHYYNNMQRRAVLRRHYAEISESEDEFEFARREDVEQQDKQCASCATKLTPLWRDAEDGTPLCNACGIRYKKYKVRCTRCWHIPRKNDNTRSNCKECGATLRFVVRKSSN